MLRNCGSITQISLRVDHVLTLIAMVLGRHRCAIQFFVCLLFSLLYIVVDISIDQFFIDQTLA